MPAWRAFVPALATDNPDLDPAYLEQLKRADAVTRARLLDGNFEYDATPGRLYSYDALTDLFRNGKNNGTKYISCDVAREGKDQTKIYVWDGWEVIDRVTIAKSTLDVVWDKIEELQGIHKVSASRTIVDEDGVGG